MSVTGLSAVSVTSTGINEVVVQMEDGDGDFRHFKNLSGSGTWKLDFPATAKGRHQIRIGIPAGGFVSGSAAIEVY